MYQLGRRSSEMEPSKKQYQLSGELVVGLTEVQPRLYSFLLKRLARGDQAQEVLQNVNLTICRKADEFEEGTDFVAWAFAIARFELMSFRQSMAREKLVFTDEVLRSIEQLDSDNANGVVRRRQQSALRSCMDQLTPKQKHLVNQRYAESESVLSISTEMGKTANAVSMSLHRIREKLLDCINRKLASEKHE